MSGIPILPAKADEEWAAPPLTEFKEAHRAVAQLLSSGVNAGVLAFVRIACRTASSFLLVGGVVVTRLKASVSNRTRLVAATNPMPNAIAHAGEIPRKLVVIGFMGGNVLPNDLVHREARLTRTLQVEHPKTIHAEIFANRRGQLAFESVLRQIGCGTLKPTLSEKQAARIVIFGHSWGASEAVSLAKRLDKAGIPVLLTIQVDSVQKQRQNDAAIPSNVKQAINFYQADGMLRGRNKIVAQDPARTTILGNYQSSYRDNPVSCAEFPWYARAFMKPHVQIENDPAVWGHIQDLILSKTS